MVEIKNFPSSFLDQMLHIEFVDVMKKLQVNWKTLPCSVGKIKTQSINKLDVTAW